MARNKSKNKPAAFMMFNVTYEDGSTPAEMAAAWDAFYKRYARERACKGLLVEIASTYNDSGNPL